MHTMLKTPIIMALSVVGAGFSSSFASNERSDVSALPKFQLQIEGELSAFRALGTVDPESGDAATIFDVVQMMLQQYQSIGGADVGCNAYPADYALPIESPSVGELEQVACS